MAGRLKRFLRLELFWTRTPVGDHHANATLTGDFGLEKVGNGAGGDRGTAVGVIARTTAFVAGGESVNGGEVIAALIPSNALDLRLNAHGFLLVSIRLRRYYVSLNKNTSGQRGFCATSTKRDSGTEQ